MIDPRVRFETLPVDARCVLDDIRIERGELADYRLMSRYHYRGAQVGAVTAILRAVLDRPTVIGRFLRRRSQRECIGVIVRCLPHLACQMRDIATGGRYRQLSLRESAIMLNREVRTISRVVVDPRFRGCGLAVRLVRAALEEVERDVIFIEALAAMGRVNPMFERAGMLRFEPPPRPTDARLIDALESVGIAPATLCSMPMMKSSLNRMDSESKAFIERELRRWNRAAGGRSRIARRRALPPDSNSLEQIITRARRTVFARPVYFLGVLNSAERGVSGPTVNGASFHAHRT